MPSNPLPFALLALLLCCPGSAGTFDDTLTILEPGPSIKKYARDIGMIYDDGIELISH